MTVKSQHSFVVIVSKILSNGKFPRKLVLLAIARIHVCACVCVYVCVCACVKYTQARGLVDILSTLVL